MRTNGNMNRSRLQAVIISAICICTLLLVVKAAMLGYQASGVEQRYKWKWMYYLNNINYLYVQATAYLDVPRIPGVPRSNHLFVLGTSILILAIAGAEAMRRLGRTPFRGSSRFSRAYFALFFGVLGIQILGIRGYQRYQYSKGDFPHWICEERGGRVQESCSEGSVQIGRITNAMCACVCCVTDKK